MNKALMVIVAPEERRALLEMSKQDVRAPHDQIRFLIIAEATKRGLLSLQGPSETQPQPSMNSQELALA